MVRRARVKKEDIKDLVQVRVKINGVEYNHAVEPRLLLVHYIRDVVGLTGTHIGCDTGHCGACTVILDGKAVKSCTVLTVQADGSEIITIEGLSKDGELHPIQQSFRDCFAVQCGYCTPGMIMASYALLSKDPSPSEERIRKGLSGNLCMCTGYTKIVEAVMKAAEVMRRDDACRT